MGKGEQAFNIKVFGELTVIEKGKKGRTLCECSCGKIKQVRAAHLLEGLVSNCGCKKDNRTKAMIEVDDMVSSSKRKDMLEVIARDNERTTRLKAFAKCKCDCGSIKSFELRNFKDLHYGSCGCYKPKTITKSPKVIQVLDTKLFGQWEVVDWVKSKPSYVNCKCTCGKIKPVRADSLLSGDSSSCGCTAAKRTAEKLRGRFDPYSQSRNPLSSIWKGMKARCYRENNKDYSLYGGRGIKICERWLGSEMGEGFKNFSEDMLSTYKKGLEIERLDVNGDYCPENCSWVCRRSQVNNINKNRRLKGFGIELNVAEWGFLLGFNCKMLGDRINKLKWEGDLEDILQESFRDRGHTLKYRGNECTAEYIWRQEGFTQGQQNGRITKYGGSIEALRSEGIVFEVVKEREKNYLGFEEALTDLRSREKDDFEIHLLYKIEKQLEDNYE